MKENYDFSKAERGKFYNPTGVFHLPIYLESDVNAYMQQVAQEKGLDVQQLVNQWLRHNIQLLQSVS